MYITVVIDINLPVTVIGSRLFVGCLNGIIVKKPSSYDDIRQLADLKQQISPKMIAAVTSPKCHCAANYKVMSSFVIFAVLYLQAYCVPDTCTLKPL